MITSQRTLAAVLVIALAMLACNYPKSTVATPDLRGTGAAATLADLQTADALTQRAAYGSATALLPVGLTPGASQVAGANSLVTQDSLCWVGPGDKFEVVSTIRAGVRVALLGRGTVGNWFIVRNPIYQDPCWIPADIVQVDPSVNQAGLPYFSPPASPTPPPTKTPTPLPLPSNTPGTPASATPSTPATP